MAPEAKKSEIKVLADSMLGEVPLLKAQMTLSHLSHEAEGAKQLNGSFPKTLIPFMT